MDSIKKRMEELERIIEEANYNYYTLDNPTISDYDYDKYLHELKDLEENIHTLKVKPLQHKKWGCLDKFRKLLIKNQ